MVINMKKIKYIFIIIIILIPIFIKSENNELKDDYYNYINKNTISKHKLKNDEYTWSTFSSLQDKVDNQSKSILKELLNSKKNPDINILYNQLLDIDTRNKENISTIKPYLDRIDNSKNIKEYIENAIYIENNLSIDIFTNISVEKDFKDHTKNIIYLSPITMDFGASSDYYVNDDYLSYRALIKQYGIKILKQYGYDTKTARKISLDITEMYKDISSKSYLANDLEDITKYYNIITKEELKKIYTNLDIDYYLKSKNINETSFSIVDINNYKAVNSYLTENNLLLLKEQTKLKILENYAPYLSSNYSNLIYELNNKIQGINKKESNEEKASEIVSNYFSYEIDKNYQNKYLNKESYNYLENMTKEIISYYKKDLKSINWLSQNTKEKAILKLEKMKINIGLPSEYQHYSNNYNLSNSNSLIENIIKISKQINNFELSKLDNKIYYPELSQTTVNAYYNPSDNSINFPSSSLELFDINNNYYENLGSIGMIIAHEITHAFDSNGSKFNEYGDIFNWWTEKDLENYKKLQKKVINYYNKYEVIDGEHINGKRTVNENIADLGAISCISNIAISKKASTKDIKKMYSSLAKMWASTSNREYEKIILLQDTHSPSKYRVNATLSSTDLFYKTYNINFFNKMYISKNKRVKVW